MLNRSIRIAEQVWRKISSPGRLAQRVPVAAPERHVPMKTIVKWGGRGTLYGKGFDTETF